MKEDGLHIRTAGSLFVRTQRLLLSEMQLFCYLPDIRLMYETERADNGKRIMFQRKTGLHGGMRTLEGDVHQQGNEDIIHVMSQSYLIEPVAYRKFEESFASIPGTEKATGLTGIGRFIKRTMQDMEADAIFCTEILQIRTIGLVRNVIHDDMSRLHFDMRFKDTGTLSQQTDKFQ